MFPRIATTVGACIVFASVAYGQGVGPRPYGAPVPIAVPQVIQVAGTQPAAAPKTVLDYVAEPYREAVAAVFKNPTMTAKANEDEFAAHGKVYDWLIENPDRTTLAWQRLKVPCVEISSLGKGRFQWTDENGSELVWQCVGRFENGVIWYATGKVKAGTLIPSAPIKAVAVLQSPRSKPNAEGESSFKPTVHLYMHTDSRVANMILKMVGPSAPKLAEQGAEQLLFFFSGIAQYIHRKPEKMEALLAPKK